MNSLKEAFVISVKWGFFTLLLSAVVLLTLRKGSVRGERGNLQMSLPLLIKLL